MIATSSPAPLGKAPACVTLSWVVERGVRQLRVELQCSDAAERRRWIESFRARFPLFGGRFARRGSAYWLVPAYRADDVMTWAAKEYRP